MNAQLVEARERWQAMQPREQRMVAGAAAFAGIALLWWLGIEPAWEGRERLGRDLPALRAQAAELAGIAQWAHAQGAPLPQADLASALQARLVASGLSAQVSAQPSGAVSVRFARSGYAATAVWAQAAARETGARLDAVQVMPAVAQTGSQAARMGNGPGVPDAGASRRSADAGPAVPAHALDVEYVFAR